MSSDPLILGAVLLSLFATASAAETAMQATVAGTATHQEAKTKAEKSSPPAKEKSIPAPPKKSEPAKVTKPPLVKYIEPDPRTLGLGCASGAD